MLATTTQKPHMRRPHVQRKEPIKYKGEIQSIINLFLIIICIAGAFFLDCILV